MGAMTVVQWLQRVITAQGVNASAPMGDATVIEYQGRPYRVVVYELQGTVHDRSK